MDSGRIRFSGTPGQLQIDEPDVLSVLENSQAKCDEIKRKRKTSLDGAKPSRNAKEYRKKGKRQKHQRGNVGKPPDLKFVLVGDLFRSYVFKIDGF